MRAFASKDGDLICLSDETDESQAENFNSSPKHLLVSNPDIAAKKGKKKGQLPLEHIFGFCKTFEKVTKQLGFQLTLKTAVLTDIIYTTLAYNNVKIDNYFLYIPSSLLMLKHK